MMPASGCQRYRPLATGPRGHQPIPVRLVAFSMTYFCFIETRAASVPHMEPLDAEDLPSATAEARRLLRQHTSAIAAHIFEGDRRLVTLHPGD